MGLPGIKHRDAKTRKTRHHTFPQPAPAYTGGLCFYCLRRVSRLCRCLDPVVPLARGGGNSYRNLVSCCRECNSRKGELAAKDFLRQLFREERLSGIELAGRLRADRRRT